MADVKISELPAGTANANAVVPATNAAGTTTQKITLGAIAALGGGPPASHTHGNITNAGAIGTTSGLPVKTGTSGVLEAGAFGTTSGTFCQGNDARLSDARTPTSHVHAGSDITSGTVPADRLPSASTSAAGVSQLSSTAEALAGTSTTRAVTPEAMHLSRKGTGRKKFWELFCDFTNPAYGQDAGSADTSWFLSTSGSGADANLYENHPGSFSGRAGAGFISLKTGTTSSGRGGYSTGFNMSTHRFDTGTTTFEGLAYLPNLADATNDYVFRIGYVRGDGLVGGDYLIGIEYDRSNSANWVGVTADGGTFSRVDTGVAVAAAKWFTVGVVFTHTLATFYINGSASGTVSSNINAPGYPFLGAHMLKTAGTTSRTAIIDYVYYRHDFSSDRTFTT